MSDEFSVGIEVHQGYVHRSSWMSERAFCLRLSYSDDLVWKADMVEMWMIG